MSSRTMPIPIPRAVRVYACCINGQPATCSLPHLAGMCPEDLTVRLNRQFHEWLESRAPGAWDAGHVTGISFSDAIE